MSFRNSKPSHLVERPCRICRVDTKALNVRTGQIELHPTCPACRSSMAKQFTLAQAQRQRQDVSMRKV